MRALLVLLILFLMTSEVFGWDLSLAPGLSAKNGVVYLVALFLIFRAVVDRSTRMEMGGLHLAFAVLILYALFSALVADMVVDYPRYDLIASGIKLKATLVDQLVFFLIFFYGVRSGSEALTVLKATLLAVVLANLVTVLDVLGVLKLGIIVEREDGRVQGALGESNQYAAFIALFLPPLFAAAAAARGAKKLVWVGAILASAAAFLMTVSRGAIVGVIVSGVWGVWLLRRYIPPARAATWVAIVVGLVGITVLALSLQYGALLQERLFQTGTVDMTEVSSGRTEIWTVALQRMAETPITFLSGFGWDVYWTMPFKFSPHNHYLALWFNLGLPGLICGVALLVIAVRAARRAIDRAPPYIRMHLMGFVFGTLAFAVAAFFVDLYHPWWYFWAYCGLTMRIAVSQTSQVPAVAPAPARVKVKRGPKVDAFGWKAAPRY